MAKIRIRIEFDASAEVLRLREDVFVKGQGVTLQEEHCDDESTFVHFGLYCDDTLVACCRMKHSGNVATIGRVAVSKEYRNRGFGLAVMDEAHKYAFESGCVSAEISSQLHAVEFYKKMGYEEYGDQYLDARILHVSMKKQL